MYFQLLMKIQRDTRPVAAPYTPVYKHLHQGQWFQKQTGLNYSAIGFFFVYSEVPDFYQNVVWCLIKCLTKMFTGTQFSLSSQTCYLIKECCFLWQLSVPLHCAHWHNCLWLSFSSSVTEFHISFSIFLSMTDIKLMTCSSQIRQFALSKTWYSVKLLKYTWYLVLVWNEYC